MSVESISETLSDWETTNSISPILINISPTVLSILSQLAMTPRSSTPLNPDSISIPDQIPPGMNFLATTLFSIKIGVCHAIDSEELVASKDLILRYSSEKPILDRRESISSSSDELSTLEQVLKKRGLMFSDGTGIESQVTVRKASSFWDNYFFDPLHNYVIEPLSKARSIFQHWGNMASQDYRHEYRRAVREAQKQKFPYQVYSKDQLETQMKEVSRITKEAQPYMLGAAKERLRTIIETGNLFLPNGIPGVGYIKALSGILLALDAMTPESPEALRTKNELYNIMINYKGMVDANEQASYHKSISVGYQPILYFKQDKDLTPEQRKWAAWGVDFYTDGQGFEISFISGIEF